MTARRTPGRRRDDPLPQGLRGCLAAILVTQAALAVAVAALALGYFRLSSRGAAQSPAADPAPVQATRTPGWATLFTHGGTDQAKWTADGIEGEIVVRPAPPEMAGRELWVYLTFQHERRYAQAGYLVHPENGAAAPTLFWVQDNRFHWLADAAGRPARPGDAGPPGTRHRIRIVLAADGRAQVWMDGQELCRGAAGACQTRFAPSLGSATVRAEGDALSVDAEFAGLRYREAENGRWRPVDGRHSFVSAGLSMTPTGRGAFRVRGNWTPGRPPA